MSRSSFSSFSGSSYSSNSSNDSDYDSDYFNQFGFGATREEVVEAAYRTLHNNTRPLIALMDQLFRNSSFQSILQYRKDWGQVFCQNVDVKMKKLILDIINRAQINTNLANQIADNIFQLIGPEQNITEFDNLLLGQKYIFIYMFIMNKLCRYIDAGDDFSKRERWYTLFGQRLNQIALWKENLNEEENHFQESKRQLAQYYRNRPNGPRPNQINGMPLQTLETYSSNFQIRLSDMIEMFLEEFGISEDAYQSYVDGEHRRLRR